MSLKALQKVVCPPTVSLNYEHIRLVTSFLTCWRIRMMWPPLRQFLFKMVRSRCFKQIFKFRWKKRSLKSVTALCLHLGSLSFAGWLALCFWPETRALRYLQTAERMSLTSETVKMPRMQVQNCLIKPSLREICPRSRMVYFHLLQ